MNVLVTNIRNMAEWLQTYPQWNKTDIQQSQGVSTCCSLSPNAKSGSRQLPEVRHTTRSTVNAATRSSVATRTSEMSGDPSATSNVQYEQAVTYFKQKLYTQALDCLDQANFVSIYVRVSFACFCQKFLAMS
jgi:hypothetical protein